MKVTVVVIGRLKEKYYQSAEAEYLKRLRPYARVSVVEVKDEGALLAAVADSSLLVAFDERGETLTSDEFARGVIAKEQMQGGGRDLVFAIGGADGHSQLVRTRANQIISFGKMTIAHRLVRLLVVEQIYRAFRILAGEPYHR